MVMGTSNKKGGYNDLYKRGGIEYLISIEVKDGSYRYEITRFNHTKHGDCNLMRSKGNHRGEYKRSYAHYLEQLDMNAKKLITSINSAMQKDEADW